MGDMQSMTERVNANKGRFSEQGGTGPHPPANPSSTFRTSGFKRTSIGGEVVSEVGTEPPSNGRPGSGFSSLQQGLEKNGGSNLGPYRPDLDDGSDARTLPFRPKDRSDSIPLVQRTGGLSSGGLSNGSGRNGGGFSLTPSQQRDQQRLADTAVREGTVDGLRGQIDIAMRENPARAAAELGDLSRRIRQQNPVLAGKLNGMTREAFQRNAPQQRGSGAGNPRSEAGLSNADFQTTGRQEESAFSLPTPDPAPQASNQPDFDLPTPDPAPEAPPRNEPDPINELPTSLRGIDLDFIHEREGNTQVRSYVPVHENGQVVEDSGVTIGAGVDLGQMNERDLNKLVDDYGVDPETAEKLKPYLGKRKEDALEINSEMPLTLTPEEARKLSDAKYAEIADTVSRRYNAAQARKGSNARFEDLPGRVKTVALSVALQHGASLSSETPRFWAALSSQDYGALEAELRNFDDTFPTRRIKEADYLIGR